MDLITLSKAVVPLISATQPAEKRKLSSLLVEIREDTITAALQQRSKGRQGPSLLRSLVLNKLCFGIAGTTSGVGKDCSTPAQD